MYGGDPYAGAPYADVGAATGNSAIISASLPALTAAGAATAIVAGTVTASLPALMASGVATIITQSTITATLPTLAAVGLGKNVVRAVIDATLPALTATAAAVTGTRRRLRSWQKCPRPASGFTERGGGRLRQGRSDD